MATEPSRLKSIEKIHVDLNRNPGNIQVSEDEPSEDGIVSQREFRSTNHHLREGGIVIEVAQRWNRLKAITLVYHLLIYRGAHRVRPKSPH